MSFYLKHFTFSGCKLYTNQSCMSKCIVLKCDFLKLNIFKRVCNIKRISL